MDDKYRGAPLRTTPEARKRADQTLRAIYGTRVKIPPPGPEREGLVNALRNAIIENHPEEWVPSRSGVEKLLRALEEIAG